jgi:hypothetical protein
VPTRLSPTEARGFVTVVLTPKGSDTLAQGVALGWWMCLFSRLKAWDNGGIAALQAAKSKRLGTQGVALG